MEKVVPDRNNPITSRQAAPMVSRSMGSTTSLAYDNRSAEDRSLLQCGPETVKTNPGILFQRGLGKNFGLRNE